MTDLVLTNELFALPINLKPVVTIYGEKFYGSEKINEKYIKALENNSQTEKVAVKIRKLVEYKEIIPCFTNKNLVKFIKWKLFAPDSVKDEVGFYDMKSKKIIILFNPAINFFAYASNKLLGELTIHECMHKLAKEKLSTFNSIFLNMEVEFYRVLWTRIFSIDKKKLDNKKIIKIINFINKTFTLKLNNNDIVKYYKLLDSEFKDLTSLPPENFKRMVTDYIVIMSIYIKDVNRFYHSIEFFKHILSPIYLAYSEALNCRNINSMCVQELFTPDEIIANYAELHTDSKIYSAINKL